MGKAKGKAFGALPFLEWCLAVRLMWSTSPQMNYPAAPSSGISASLRQATGYQPEYFYRPKGRGIHPSSASGGLKLKNGRHRIFVFLLQTLTRFFQLLFLGSEFNRAFGLKLLNEVLHL